MQTRFPTLPPDAKGPDEIDVIEAHQNIPAGVPCHHHPDGVNFQITPSYQHSPADDDWVAELGPQWPILMNKVNIFVVPSFFLPSAESIE